MCVMDGAKGGGGSSISNSPPTGTYTLQGSQEDGVMIIKDSFGGSFVTKEHFVMRGQTKARLIKARVKKTTLTATVAYRKASQNTQLINSTASGEKLSPNLHQLGVPAMERDQTR